MNKSNKCYVIFLMNEMLMTKVKGCKADSKLFIGFDGRMQSFLGHISCLSMHCDSNMNASLEDKLLLSFLHATRFT